eukprot:scaffold52036_cov49-Attheya_sp.AAC.1
MLRHVVVTLLEVEGRRGDGGCIRGGSKQCKEKDENKGYSARDSDRILDGEHMRPNVGSLRGGILIQRQQGVGGFLRITEVLGKDWKRTGRPQNLMVRGRDLEG